MCGSGLSGFREQVSQALHREFLIRAHGHQHHKWVCVQSSDDRAEQLERCVVGPLEVVHSKHARRWSAKKRQQDLTESFHGPRASGIGRLRQRARPVTTSVPR